MKLPLVVLLCLLASSEWVSSFFVDKRQGGNSGTKVKGNPPEEDPSDGTFQSDMKLGVFQREIEERIQDMKTGRRRRKAYANLNYRWPGGIIPYVITESSGEDSDVIESALGLWQSQTCLDFEPYSEELVSRLSLNHHDHLTFKKLDGCWSYIGKQGRGAQDISIGQNCAHLGTVAHEVAHAMGFHHEQSRPDRDDFVTIIYENIRSGMENNFVKYEAETQSLTHDVPYDPSSIMHYNTMYFSDNGKPTITTKNVFDQFKLGQREYLSFYDVLLANLMYNCVSDCDASLSCLNGGYEATAGGTCKCMCKPGFTGSQCEVDNTGQVSTCNFELTDTSGTLTSPNYPNNYDDGLKCAWYIKGSVGSTISLTFEDIDVENEPSACAWDSVAVRTSSMFVDDDKFCGTALPPVQNSISNEMMLVMISDGSYNQRGFKAHYVINPGKGTCGGTLTDSGYLASPNYPDNYDSDADCKWTIEVDPGSRVALTLSHLDIGQSGICSDDSLKISLTADDVTQVRPLLLCGKNLPTGPIVSLGNRMTLQFTTDSSNENAGFAATFHSVLV